MNELHRPKGSRRRAWLKDLKLNHQSELLLEVERTTKADVVLTVSTTKPDSTKAVTSQDLISTSISMNVPSPLTEIRVYLTDRTGAPYDDYRETTLCKPRRQRSLLNPAPRTEQAYGLASESHFSDQSADKTQPSSSELFISHAAADAPLAEFIEQQARSSIPGVAIFRTTRTGSIAAGKEWLREIGRHLKSADRFLVLLTPWSLKRPWIWFEGGAAWIREKTVVPVTAGGLAANDVPEPLRLLQLLSLENPDDVRQAFKELGGSIADPAAFAAGARTFTAKARADALRAEHWDGVEIEGKLYALDGPMDDFTESTPRGVSDDLVRKLRENGLRLVMGIDGKLWKENAKGYTNIYEVDVERRRKHPIISEDEQVLLAKWDKGV